MDKGASIEPTAQSDQELVATVLQGDQASFTELVARHTDRLYSLALRLLGNATEAEDATQEVFIRAYAHLASFHGSASFATWLYRIMLNVCRDMLRRRQVRERSVNFSRVNQLWADERYSVDPELVVLALESRRVIDRALRQLPSTYRATLLLHEVDGLTLNEIATLMDAPLSTVKSRLQRARMALVTLLDDAAQLGDVCPAKAEVTPSQG